MKSIQKRKRNTERKVFKRVHRCAVCVRAPHFQTLDDVRSAIRNFKHTDVWKHDPILQHGESAVAIPYLRLTDEMLQYPNILIGFKRGQDSFFFQNLTLHRCTKPPVFNWSRKYLPKKLRHALEKRLLLQSRMSICVESRENPDMCCAFCYEHAKTLLARNVALYHHKLIQQLFKMAMKKSFRMLDIHEEVIKLAGEMELVDKLYTAQDAVR